MNSKANFQTAADCFDGWRDDVLTGTPPTLWPVGSGELARLEIGPGLVMLIGGAPGAGKTAFVMQLATDALRMTPTLRVLVANCEMTPAVLLNRQLARLSGIDVGTIRYRRFTAEHADRLDQGLHTLESVADRLAFLRPPFDLANIAASADAHRADLLVTGEEGRVEIQFLQRAAHLLVDNGVLALVCPEDVAGSYETAEFFQERFYEISAMPFPEQIRRYNETIVLGYKRKQPNDTAGNGYAWEWLERRMQARVVYRLPPGERPRQFRKSEPTDSELARLVAQSPLRFHLQRPADQANCRPRPPMSPGIGQDLAASEGRVPVL